MITISSLLNCRPARSSGDQILGLYALDVVRHSAEIWGEPDIKIGALPLQLSNVVLTGVQTR